MIDPDYAKGLVIKSSTDDHVSVSGYASVFDLVDSHNDVIVKGAFAKTKSSRNIKFLWQHDRTQPIGVINMFHEDEHGLYVEATINTQTQQGKEAIALVKQGAINGLSIGFNILKADYNKDGKREITLVDLWEISLVTFPSNDQAQLSHVKNMPDPLSHLNELLDRVITQLAKLN